MDSIFLHGALSLMRIRSTATTTTTTTATGSLQVPCLLFSCPGCRFISAYATSSDCFLAPRRSSSAIFANGMLTDSSVSPNAGVYTVGDFMTRKEELYVVKPVDEALETLVERRITGFPVIDDDWKLVALVSDYDLLTLDSISDFQLGAEVAQ